MQIKTQIVEQYKSAFILPALLVHWEWGIFTISFAWLKWSIDIDFLK